MKTLMANLESLGFTKESGLNGLSLNNVAVSLHWSGEKAVVAVDDKQVFKSESEEEILAFVKSQLPQDPKTEIEAPKKLKLENFNIAYGKQGCGLIVEHNDKFFNLNTASLVNTIAGNCFSDWDDEDTDELDAIGDLIDNFVNNNHEENNISMWFD